MVTQLGRGVRVENKEGGEINVVKRGTQGCAWGYQKRNSKGRTEAKWRRIKGGTGVRIIQGCKRWQNEAP